MTMLARHEDPFDLDRKRLHQLGYAQELKRRLRGFSNFAVSFSIISILTAYTLYGYAMSTGGPVDITIGYAVVCVFTLLVGLGMAEVCSAYPTSGGMYYWASRLAPGGSGPAWSWFTGWFNLLGQVAVTAGIDFGCSIFGTGLLSVATGIRPTRGVVLVFLAIVLVVHGLLNTFGNRLVGFLSDVSAWWHLLGVALIVFLLWILPTHHNSISFVFTHLANSTGFSAKWYVFLLGLLFAQYNMTGYDASAHVIEETGNAQTAGPRGIVFSIGVSAIAGLILFITTTFAIDHYSKVASASIPPLQLFENAIGSGAGQLLFLVVWVATFFCGMASVLANSRMLYAFSRDGAVPFSRFWHHIDPVRRVPTRSVWFAVVGAFILCIPYYWSPTAFSAVTSIATIGLYIAYVIPVLLRRIAGRRFQQGPFNLGKWSAAVGWTAVIWVAFIAVLFMLPESYPVTISTFNYAPIAVGVVLCFSGSWWLLGARKWFTGPRPQGSSEEELERIEEEFTEIEEDIAEVD